MVPSTPGSTLKRKIQMKLKTLNQSKVIKVVEKLGQKFIDVLKMKNKKQSKPKCNDPNCLIRNSEKGGDCRRNGIVYKITCKECNDRYIGETSRNGHTRGIEHHNDSKSKNNKTREKSVLLRHEDEKHQGQEVKFEMKVVSTYQNNAFSR